MRTMNQVSVTFQNAFECEFLNRCSWLGISDLVSTVRDFLQTLRLNVFGSLEFANYSIELKPL